MLILICSISPVQYMMAAAAVKPAQAGSSAQSMIMQKAVTAVLKGDKKTLLALLKTKKISINTQDSKGRTLIYHAALNKKSDIALFLLARGSNPNIPDKEGNTPLELVCGNGDLKMATILVQHKANTNMSTSDANKGSWSPLMEACKVGSRDMVLLLLENGADVNYTTKKTQNCALGLASSYGHESCVQLLLQNGADPDQGLGDACVDLHSGIVKTLLEAGANPNTRDFLGITPLIWAINHVPYKYTGQAFREVKMDVIQMLIEHGADINMRASEGDTPLLAAVTCADQEGSLELVRYLINKGANISVSDKEGITPFMWACAFGNLETCALLMRSSNDVNLTDIKGRTALMLTSDDFSGYPNVVDYLLLKGAKVNVQALDGRTALMMACARGNIGAVKSLLAAKADPRIKDKEGNDSFDYALMSSNPQQITDLLRNYRSI